MGCWGERANSVFGPAVLEAECRAIPERNAGSGDGRNVQQGALNYTRHPVPYPKERSLACGVTITISTEEPL